MNKEQLLKELEDLLAKSGSRSAKLEASQDGYEYGVEDAINVVTKFLCEHEWVRVGKLLPNGTIVQFQECTKCYKQK